MFSYYSAIVPESSMMLCLEKFARWWYQLDVRQLQCLVEFVRMRHRSLLSTIALFLQVARRYKTVLVSSALPSALMSSLLRTLQHGNADVQSSVHRILHSLLDRHGNLALLQHVRFVISS